MSGLFDADEMADQNSATWTIPLGWRADNVGACRSCHAPVMWAITPAGKKSPLNADGSSHFSSCPQARWLRALRRDAADWFQARRGFVTSTDIPVLMGLSPYRVEADLAAEKLSGREEEVDPKRLRMFDLGHRLEAVIRDVDEAEHGIRLRKVHRFIVSRQYPWAATSLDFERVGQKVIVEAKTSRSKRWDDGLPQDVEAQVRWQMGVAGYPAAHVALLRGGSELECFDLEHDAATFEGLVEIAQDFRARLVAGGPFAESGESLKRRYPRDNGTELVADGEVSEAIRALVAVRTRRKTLKEQEEVLETAIKSRMGAASVLVGQGWRATWRRTKDRTVIEWRPMAEGLLTTRPEEERAALLSIYTRSEPGFRPLVVRRAEDDAEAGGE